MNRGMIYINGRFLMQQQTGVNRYAYEICRSLMNLNKQFIIICPQGTIYDCYDISTFKIDRWGMGNSHLWEQCVLPFYFFGKKGKYILINFTGIGPISIHNKIITIHDLAFLINPHWYSWSYTLLYRLLTPLSIKTSKKILTVSHFSKEEIFRLMKTRKDKIEVVYNAVPSFFNSYKEENHHQLDLKGGKYILAVSSIDPRKNFDKLLSAFCLMESCDINLYIVGSENRIYMADSILPKVNMNSRIRWLGRITDEELLYYYKNAICFVSSSLYEGFGIPAIEAMEMECPVIVSDIPVFHEIYGEAAIYVDPLDENEIAEKMDRLCVDKSLREQLISKGLKQITLYDWRESAIKVCFAIDHVLK